MIWILFQILFSCKNGNESNIDDNEDQLQCIVSGLQFAEGPAFFNNYLYFTDISANKIYKWNAAEGLHVFKDNSGAANGLYFDNEGKLFVCEGGNKRIVCLDQSLNATIVTDKFNGKPYNEPNDLWISPGGNIYFTDPVYTGTLSQEGEYVYCVHASTGEVTRVIDDLVKPNGIVGNSDGSTLYVADWGASKIYEYEISVDGTLSNMKVFAEIRADGLTIDDEDNIYAAGNLLKEYDPQGNLIMSISIPGTLTNLCFVRTDKKILYMTTHNEVYLLKISNN